MPRCRTDSKWKRSKFPAHARMRTSFIGSVQQHSTLFRLRIMFQYNQSGLRVRPSNAIHASISFAFPTLSTQRASEGSAFRYTIAENVHNGAVRVYREKIKCNYWNEVKK